jgi:hypothetical protein
MGNEILLLSYWEHFKAAKDLALIYSIEHPKRVAIENELQILTKLINHDTIQH